MGIALLELMLKSDSMSALYIVDKDSEEDVFAFSDPRLFTIGFGK
jgi:hypothetical protein